MKPVLRRLIFPGLMLLVASSAHAAGGKVTSPTGTAPDRYVYYPGTEDLAKDEIRLFACGTGLPAARRAQQATCWLVELGNGDKTVSPDHAWSVAGPKPPPKPPAKGTVPDPISDFIMAGRWNPAEAAQADMIKAFKKEHNMK